MTSAAITAVDELHPDLPGWTEQLAITMASAGITDDFRIDRGDRIAVAADPPAPRSVRWAKLLIVLAAAVGAGTAGLLGAHRFLKPDSVSSPAPVRSLNAPAGISNANEGSRRTIHPTVVRKADRAPTANAPAAPTPHAAPRIAHAKPPRAAVTSASPASSYVPPAPSPAAGADKPNLEARLTPVPETRPTTIDGWVLREIVNGTAVLEGPDGVWRVKRGDTVPGLGQIEDVFGWGNRMIVATSRGLITTR